MRKSWHEYFAEIALKVSERATCPRLHVGAVIVKDKRIIATGYNGSTHGDEHCEDVGCKVVDGHCIRTIHAETNAIYQCAKNGIDTEGSIIYVTHLPCLNCTKAIIQAGIKKIYYIESYRKDEYTVELLEKSGVEVEKI